MKQHIAARTLESAHYMLSAGATVRRCAARFGVSKTTVHKDMRVRLPLIDKELARQVDALLGLNRRERHIRGGQATKEKYKTRGDTPGELRDTDELEHGRGPGRIRRAGGNKGAGSGAE